MLINPCFRMKDGKMNIQSILRAAKLLGLTAFLPLMFLVVLITPLNAQSPTEPITTQTVDETVPLTEPIIITNTVTVTVIYPAWPVFVEARCNFPVTILYIPGPVEVSYYTVGDPNPGGTITVTASLRKGVDWTMRGQTEWVHHWLPLNCEAPKHQLYLPIASLE